ncbi:MAG TPA: hypothetical protein P5531_14160 [Bacteroidales bacterium]|nr:hypothetical protein [Bacteroidales bacterium]HSA44708.1 hypothetical protein [Bacteroidales bacterium]
MQKLTRNTKFLFLLGTLIGLLAIGEPLVASEPPVVPKRTNYRKLHPRKSYRKKHKRHKSGGKRFGNRKKSGIPKEYLIRNSRHFRVW